MLKMLKNKKGNNLFAIFGLILAVLFVSIIAMTVYIIGFGVSNDYLFYEMQLISENLTDLGVVTATTANLTLTQFEDFQSLISYGDDYWFAMYLIFIVISIIVTYQFKEVNDIQFMMYLFYGLMIFLFIGGLFETFTNWFTVEITSKLIPNALSHFPKFNWYLNNLGIVVMIHSLVLLFITRLELDFFTKNQIKDREIRAVAQNTDEIN